uniref:RdRp n=1 Tax=viral metagenome TaxID=1070528 RepID=A0A2V0RCG5_9ZZZZ
MQRKTEHDDNDKQVIKSNNLAESKQGIFKSFKTTRKILGEEIIPDLTSRFGIAESMFEKYGVHAIHAPPFSGKTWFCSQGYNKECFKVYDIDTFILQEAADRIGSIEELQIKYPGTPFDAFRQDLFHTNNECVVMLIAIQAIIKNHGVEGGNLAILLPNYGREAMAYLHWSGITHNIMVLPTIEKMDEWAVLSHNWRKDRYSIKSIRNDCHAAAAEVAESFGIHINQTVREAVVFMLMQGAELLTDAMYDELVRLSGSNKKRCSVAAGSVMALFQLIEKGVTTYSHSGPRTFKRRNGISSTPTFAFQGSREFLTKVVDNIRAGSSVVDEVMAAHTPIQSSMNYLTRLITGSHALAKVEPASDSQLDNDIPPSREDSTDLQAEQAVDTTAAVSAETVGITGASSAAKHWHIAKTAYYLELLKNSTTSNSEDPTPDLVPTGLFEPDIATASADSTTSDENMKEPEPQPDEAPDSEFHQPLNDERELPPGDEPVYFDATRLAAGIKQRNPVRLHQSEYYSYSEVYPDASQEGSPNSTLEYMKGTFPGNDDERVDFIDGYDNNDEWLEMVEIASRQKAITIPDWAEYGRQWIQKSVIETGVDTPMAQDMSGAVDWVRTNVPALMGEIRDKYHNEARPAYINWLRGLWQDKRIPTTVYWGLLPEGAIDKLPRKEAIAITGKSNWADWLMSIKENQGKFNSMFCQEVYAALKSTKSDMIKEIAQRFEFAHTTAAKKANITLQSMLDKIRTDSCDYMKRSVSALLGFHGPKYNILRKQSNSFIVCMLIWIFGNGLRADLFAQVVATGIFTIQRDKWSDIAKEMHTLVHSSCTMLGVRLTPSECSELMYFDILYGRSGETPNWHDARVARSVVPVPKVVYSEKTKNWESSDWERCRDAKLYEIIAPAVAAAAEKGIPTLKEWVSQRHKFGAGGTASGLPTRYKSKHVGDVFLDTTVFTEKDLESKMNWLKKGIMEHDDLLEWMERRMDGSDTGMSEEVLGRVTQAIGELPPIYNIVSAAGKPEELGNKVRELYASYMADYLLQNYVLSVFEKLIDHPDVDLGSADDGQINRDLEIIAENGKGFKLCWDYADFNMQHTGLDMQAFFTTVQEAARTHKAPNDFVRVAQWVGRSMLNTLILFPDKDVDPLLVHDTLMSGWRGTTVLNTCLNACYLHGMEVSYQAYYSTGKQLLQFRKANGDDVIARVEDWGQGLAFLELAEKFNIIGKLVKQRLDPYDGEYLRVSYYKNRHARTSMCRGIATLVTGNWIGTGHSNLIGMKEQIANQMALMRRRGLNSATAWLCEKILRKKHMVIMCGQGLAKGGIVYAPSGSGKSTFVKMNMGRLGEVILVDGDKYVDWYKAMKAKQTVTEAANLIKAWLDFDREDKFIILVHPCATALGLDKVPSVVVIPNEVELARNLKARTKQLGRNSTLTAKGMRQTAYEFAMMRGLNIMGTLYDGCNSVAQQLGDDYKFMLRVPDWVYKVSRASNGWGTNGVTVLRDKLPDYPGITKYVPRLSEAIPRDMSDNEVNELQRELFSRGYGVVKPKELVDKLAVDNYMTSLNNSLNSKLEREDLSGAVEWWLQVMQIEPMVQYEAYPDLEPDTEALANAAVERIAVAITTGKLRTAEYINKEMTKGERFTRFEGYITRISNSEAASIVEIARMRPEVFGLNATLLEAVLKDKWVDNVAASQVPANWAPEISNIAMELYRMQYGLPENVTEYNYNISILVYWLGRKVAEHDLLKNLVKY